MNYNEAINFVYNFTNYEAVPRPHAEDNYDLRRLFEILERLGNPHLKAKSLHITGTNGKGSTAAMLASVMTAAGYKTGLYTSPHLITTRERFMIDGKMISESDLADIMTRLKPHIEEVNRKATYGKLTVFEILTVLCFVYFAENKLDFQVMEVGMGGRYDATNVVKPEVCLLTTISYDHCDILGDTLTKIAGEKSGIIKPGCTVISHPQEEEAAVVIRRACREQRVKLIQVGQDVTLKALEYDFEHQAMEIKGRLGTYQVSIPLLGQFQLNNTAAVVAALEVLIENGYKITPEAIRKGLANVQFPGRMNIVSRNPLTVIDGGHNPGAAHNLKEALLKYFKPTRRILVIGIAGDKDIPAIIQELAPVFQTVIVTRANSQRAAKTDRLSAEFAKYGVSAVQIGNVKDALNEARKIASPQDLIVVTGSLYVVGEAKEYIEGYTGNH
ncbi:MAG TPA: folylpolyglutamate synthase/dihydrofolate synthase family protein [Dehalococcoidales bacterium]|nr:folylpolyglutamate synthase/dihydrofolate synthase family protein [Dehalococcoidales bacterium]